MSRIHLCAWKQSSACSWCKEPHDWGSWRLYQVTQTYPTSRLNTNPKDLVLTCSMLVEQGGTKWCLEPKRREEEWDPWAMQKAAGIPGYVGLQYTTKDQTSSGSLQAANIGKRPLHAWNQLFFWFLGVCHKGSRCIKKSQAKKLTHLFLFTTDIFLSSAWNHLPHTTTNIEAVEQFFYHPHKIRSQETQGLIISKQKTYK